MTNYSGLNAIKAPFDKPNIGSAEIISLGPSTAEIKSAEINSVNSVAKSQKFIPAEITRYMVNTTSKWALDFQTEQVLCFNRSC